MVAFESKITFATEADCEVALQSLEVDAGVESGARYSRSGEVFHVKIDAPDNRILRMRVNAFLNSLRTVADMLEVCTEKVSNMLSVVGEI